MRQFCGHPDDPDNPNGGRDISDEELEELEIEEWENIYQSNKEEN